MGYQRTPETSLENAGNSLAERGIGSRRGRGIRYAEGTRGMQKVHEVCRGYTRSVLKAQSVGLKGWG